MPSAGKEVVTLSSHTPVQKKLSLERKRILLIRTMQLLASASEDGTRPARLSDRLRNFYHNFKKLASCSLAALPVEGSAKNEMHLSCGRQSTFQSAASCISACFWGDSGRPLLLPKCPFFSCIRSASTSSSLSSKLARSEKILEIASLSNSLLLPLAASVLRLIPLASCK